jgi:SNF2 family DNA or RNA helicase
MPLGTATTRNPANLGIVSLIRCWGAVEAMGLGKTLQTLAWLQHRKNGGSQKPCLLVCPTSVMDNWKAQAEKFTPALSLSRHHGFQRAKTGVAIFAHSRGRDLVITTYGTLKNDVEILTKVDWDAVILDESQNIKTPDTAVSKAAREVGRGVVFRLALTGTPIENRVIDLWTQFDFLNPGLLGSQAEFKRRFSSLLNAKKATSAPDQQSRDEDAEALKRLTSPFLMRRLKTDPTIAPDLPEKIETEEWGVISQRNKPNSIGPR